MKTAVALVALLPLSVDLGKAADPPGIAPKAEQVEIAINEGVDLRYPEAQQIGNLKIRKGGKTERGDWVYLCTAQLKWKVGSEDFLKSFSAKAREEAKRQPGPESLKELAISMAPLAVSMALGEFKAGDSIAELPVRVSLVRAGDDWIVLDAAFPKGFVNPLDKLYEGAEKEEK